jgi:serine/threonine protein kinase
MECMRNNFVKGQVLDGRFRCVAPLNHGSFGMVFLAEDLTTQQQVAIKCLIKPNVAPTTPSVLTTDEGVEELACHATLKCHDHLVNLLHHFETDAHTYLVLEYCSQGDLYEAIRLGRGPLETEHVRDFMLQLVGAVEHMHSRALYHRDIKPENIFIMQDGSMKLGDFGLATRSRWCYESSVGSDRYMAPEQYDPAGNGYSPAKADIWSIGICLLNILFSRNPFVTPTDSDILFADYRRDRQSLFDVFPNMSQDTFEVLTIAMAIDPDKRDLSALRQAILRVVSFTIDDESLDEFCTEERDVVRASANREPLRTPSIQSPQINAGDSFPWAKALHASPGKTARQLSAIPDTEIYDEDLFSPSENCHHLGESWFSVHQNTPSLASAFDSGFGGSFKSMAIRKPEKRNPPRPDAVPVSGSLPMQASRPIPTMSMVFGKKKDAVAKSWSDLWDEEEEESEQEELAFKERHAQKSRRWSDESQPELTVRPGVLTEAKSYSSINVLRSPGPKSSPRQKRIGSPNENEPFGFRGHYQKYSTDKGTDKGTDKWAALGKKRRNFQPAKERQAPIAAKRRSMTMGWRKEGNNGQRDHRPSGRPWLDQDWRRDQYTAPETKRNNGGVTDEDDAEWVGVFNLHL